jgi:formamidopyrimidine-DNA glycosylase
MPELPEVENLRRSLEPLVVGARVLCAELLRDDMLASRAPTARVRHALGALEQRSIREIRRHGKQLLLCTDGPALAVHLGMTGVLLVTAPEDPTRPHLHARLRLAAAEHNAGSGARGLSRRQPREIRFHDPRRFGWLSLHCSESDAVERCWSRLGPDALSITSAQLAERLAARRTAVKAALLDQSIVAGLGNIYVDEALFRAGLHPKQPAGSLDGPKLSTLAEACRLILHAALASGGSTIRDYVDACGLTGRFAGQHRVYGRAGQPCLACGSTLRRGVIGGRTTVHCPVCQPLRRHRAIRATSQPASRAAGRSR